MNIAKHMELIFVAAVIVLCAASYPSEEQTSSVKETSVTQVSRPAA